MVESIGITVIGGGRGLARVATVTLMTNLATLMKSTNLITWYLHWPVTWTPQLFATLMSKVFFRLYDKGCIIYFYCSKLDTCKQEQISVPEFLLKLFCFYLGTSLGI